MDKISLNVLMLCFITIIGCKKHDNKLYSYYKNGDIRIEIERIDSNKLYGTYYDKYGNIEAEGTVLNEKPKGWWKMYKNNKIKKGVEYVTFQNKVYSNQQITYDTNGKIIDSLSDYYIFKIPDTIKKGQTKIKAYYNRNFNNKSQVYICVGYNVNKDFSNLNNANIDTFYVENPKNGWFGLRYESPGKKIVRGFVYERYFEVVDNIRKVKDSSALILNEHKKFFEKEIYVKP